MASFEEYIEGLLPLQQETIAKAALAGVRWEVTSASDWAWRHEDDNTKMHKLKRTKFSAYIGETYLGDFDDIYEAALVGLSVVERDNDTQGARTTAGDRAIADGAFALLPENAEPAAEQVAYPRWPRLPRR